MAGRPRTFDREAALEVALGAFWERGYDATSISQLTSEMGIAPPSLYAAFGDKERLFREAAACYLERLDQGMAEVLALTDVREAIERLLIGTAEAHTAPAGPAGCFVLSEPHLTDERSRLRDLIATRLQAGVDDGQLAAGTDAAELADFVFSVIAGMSARARDGATRAELLATVGWTMAAWPGAAAAP